MFLTQSPTVIGLALAKKALEELSCHLVGPTCCLISSRRLFTGGVPSVNFTIITRYVIY